MNRLNWPIRILLSGLILPLVSVADSHGPGNPDFSTDQSTLVAIKEALVSEAQATESKVVNTAWLDAKGQLHESLMVQSSMRVRGIQVQTYLDEIQKPERVAKSSSWPKTEVSCNSNPISSSHSLKAVVSIVSPGSSFPPGNAYCPA